jgi:hypothetical protein
MLVRASTYVHTYIHTYIQDVGPVLCIHTHTHNHIHRWRVCYGGLYAQNTPVPHIHTLHTNIHTHTYIDGMCVMVDCMRAARIAQAAIAPRIYFFRWICYSVGFDSGLESAVSDVFGACVRVCMCVCVCVCVCACVYVCVGV